MENKELSSSKISSLVYNIDEDILKKDPFKFEIKINDENKEKIISNIEKLIRNSFEYKHLIETYKIALDVKSCVFFKDFSLENGMRLEFHHHPFTLYEYTEAVINKYMEDNDCDYIIESEICEKVVLLHYYFKVGLVPLDATSHSQIHDKELDIHPDLIIGDYDKFYEEYKKYLSDYTKMRYTEYIESFHDDKDIVYPKNFNYIPTIINASNKHLLTTTKLDKFLIEDKINNVNNDYLSKLLQS